MSKTAVLKPARVGNEWRSPVSALKRRLYRGATLDLNVIQVISSYIARPRGVPVLLACMPKSGSTFMSRVLTECSDYTLDKNLRLSADVQEFSPVGLFRARDRRVISQCHMVASNYAVEQVNEYGIKVIVLERNVLDALVSLQNHCNRDPVMLRNMSPWFGYFGADFLGLPPERQLDRLIELALRWYVLFHVTWKRQQRNFLTPPLMCRYEQVFPDIESSFPGIFEFLECDYSREKLSQLTPTNTKSRFDVGRPGRGAELLSDEQKARARSIIREYGPEADDLIYW